MEILYFKGFHGYKSKCGLTIYMRKDRAIVQFTELDDNPGTSVTNFIEHLATMIYHERFKGYPVESIRWVEHYPASKIREETFDEVTLTWDGKEFSNPKWRMVQSCQL